MITRLRARVTFANLVSFIALFVALGGTSYGLATGSIDSREIQNSSVRSRDIRNNDLRSRDVRNFSLLERDFKPGELPAGPRGATGATGATGPRGATGATGATGAAFPTGNLPSGRTMKGVYSLGGEGTDRAVAHISFPVQLASAPDVRMTRVDPNEPGNPSTALCPGSATNPLAAAGFLCIYEAQRFGTGTSVPGLCDAAGNTCTNTGGTSISSRWGTYIQFTPTVDNNNYGSNGTWAVTAP
jgi:hypothetical protein